MTTTFEPSHRIRPLDELHVLDAMHPGMISCPPETPMRTVARMMVRPLGGAVVALAGGNATRARFHVATLRGRLSGYRAGAKMRP